MTTPYQSFSGDATNGADYTKPANYKETLNSNNNNNNNNGDLEAANNVVPDAVSKYETAMPIRVDYAAAMTYLLGAVSGIIFLMFEYKNDYVRFNAWQSCLVFTPMLIVQFIFIFISMGFFWFLFVLSALVAVWCAYKAHQGADQLSRYELPLIGHIASRWCDTE